MKNFTPSAAEIGMRLDRWLKRHYSNFPHSYWVKALRTGLILVNNAKQEISYRLQTDDQIQIKETIVAASLSEPKNTPKHELYNKEAKELAAQLRELIIFQNQHFALLNKPSGVAVQGGTGIKISIADILQLIFSEQEIEPKLVHRIDKDTSGLLLIAKSLEAARDLTRMFAEHKIRKTYLAITEVVPSPNAGEINIILAKHSDGMIRPAEEGSATHTKYKVNRIIYGKGSQPTKAEVVLKPTTGFTHQLRVHMNHIGCPILGDNRYNQSKRNNAKYPLMLHAFKLDFTYKGKQLHFTAPLPKYWPK